MRAAAVLLSSLIVALAIAATGVVDGPERASLDARFALRGTQPVEGLAVVAIDEATLNQPGTHWPLPRGEHGQMLDTLRRAGARQVVYDVQFTEPSGRPGQDEALFEAVARFPGTILATGESNERGETRVLGGDENLASIGARAGAANLPGEADDVVRRYEHSVGRLDSIATIAANRFGTAPSDARALIDFRGPPGTIPTYSFADVLAGKVDPERFRGRIVVVGASAATLQDLHPTSAAGRQMPGPEIQASAIWTAMHDNPLQETPDWVAFVLPLLFAAVAAGTVLFLGARRGVPVTVVLAVAYAGATQLAFNGGAVLPVAAPLVALLAAAGIAGGVRAAVTVAERRRVAWRNHELEAAVAARTAELEATQLEALERLARAAELRDDDTGEHIDRMSRHCERVALVLGWTPEDADRLRRASALHDIGKIGMPDGILRKPGRLDDEEIAIMRRHTADGAAILAKSPSPMLQLAERVARTHHERWDGTGYPAQLAGEAIPIEGRIAAVCDVFDALVSERPYKRAWSQAEALAEISAQRGRHFDPVVADALMTSLGDAPFVADVSADPAVDAPGPAGPVAERPVGLLK